MTIYIDGWCPNCQRFSKWIRRFDFQKNIEIRDIRIDENPAINRELAKQRIASIDHLGKISYGFDTILKIIEAVHLLWFLYPFLYCLKAIELGDKIYDELAIRRKIIPNHCNENECFN